MCMIWDRLFNVLMPQFPLMESRVKIIPMTWKPQPWCLEHNIHLTEFCANEGDGDDGIDDAGGDNGSGAGGVVMMLI